MFLSPVLAGALLLSIKVTVVHLKVDRWFAEIFGRAKSSRKKVANPVIFIKGEGLRVHGEAIKETSV